MATRAGSLTAGVIEAAAWSEAGRYVTHGAQDGILGGIGGAGVMHYAMQARDSAGPPGSYVQWVTTDRNAAYPDEPPFGGPLVEIIELASWSVSGIST